MTYTALACLFIPRKPTFLFVSYAYLLISLIAATPLLVIARYIGRGQLKLLAPELLPYYSDLATTVLSSCVALAFLWRPSVRQSYGWHKGRSAAYYQV